LVPGINGSRRALGISDLSTIPVKRAKKEIAGKLVAEFARIALALRTPRTMYDDLLTKEGREK